eukprot:4864476-Pyramimonas_sp.AAC.1
MQNTGHMPEDLESLGAWCGARGWSMRALASATAAGMNTSAGVAAFARAGLGLPEAPKEVIVSGRRRRLKSIFLAGLRS